jgi:hypothetical protein
VDARPRRIEAFGTVTMPDAQWERTKNISAVIAPLAAQTTVAGLRWTRRRCRWGFRGARSTS